MDTTSHFTAVDISIDEDGTKRCVILDAANDPRMNNVNKVFNDREYKIYKPLRRGAEGKGLQSDTFSCPYFAYEHAKACALMPDLYKDMERIVEEDGKVYLDRLPPPFIKHAQSLRFIKSYCENPKNKSAYGTEIDTLQKHIREHTTIAFDQENGYVPLRRMEQNWSMKATTQQLLGELYFSRHEAVITANLASYSEVERTHLKRLICGGLFNKINGDKLNEAMAYYIQRYRETRAKLSETIGVDALSLHQLRAIDEQIVQIYAEKNGTIKTIREQTLNGYLEHYALLLERKSKLRDEYGEEAAIFLENIDFNCTEVNEQYEIGLRSYKGFTKIDLILDMINNYEAYLKERKLLFSMDIPDVARNYWRATTTEQISVLWDNRRDYLEDIKSYTRDVQKFNEILSARGYRAGNDEELDAFVEQQKIALFDHYNKPMFSMTHHEPSPREPFFSAFEAQLDDKIAKKAVKAVGADVPVAVTDGTDVTVVSDVYAALDNTHASAVDGTGTTASVEAVSVEAAQQNEEKQKVAIDLSAQQQIIKLKLESFNAYLSAIKTKADGLRNRGHNDVARVMDTFHEELTQAKDNYLSSTDKDEFITKCNDAYSKASNHALIKQHRDLGTFLNWVLDFISNTVGIFSTKSSQRVGDMKRELADLKKPESTGEGLSNTAVPLKM